MYYEKFEIVSFSAWYPIYAYTNLTFLRLYKPDIDCRAQSEKNGEVIDVGHIII